MFFERRFSKLVFRSVFVAAILVFSGQSFASIRLAPGLTGAGFRMSLVIPQYFDPGFGFGGQVDIRLIDWFHVYPSLEFSHVGRQDYYTPQYHIDHTLTEFAFNGDVRFYPLYLSPRSFFLEPFVGGGFAFAVVNEDRKYPDPYSGLSNHSNDFQPAFDFLAGCDIPVGALKINLELKGRVGSGYNLFKTTAGLTFPLNVSFSGK